MKRAHILRTSLVIAAISAALSAHAWIISAAGDINNLGIITTADYEFSNLAPIPVAFGYTVWFFNNGVTTGNFTSGGNVLDVVGQGFVSNANNTWSYSGVWTETNLTNILVAQQGTYSATFDLNSLRYEYNFAGAVPEPAPIAALGMGVIGLLVRRRRKA